VNTQTLHLLSAILMQVEWSTDRTVVMDLRREVTRWLTRVFPVSLIQSSSIETHKEVLSHTIHEWSLLAQEIFPDSSLLVDKPPQQAFRWIARIHLDSLCFGFSNFTTKKADSSGNVCEETTQVDRTVLTLQCIGPLCQMNQVPNLPTLMSIFGDTCADVSRTLNPSLAVKNLIDFLESSDLTRADSEILSQISQQMLSEILTTQFFIIQKKVEQRLDAQYAKARKFASMEELDELEDRKRNPPVWELYSELLTYEPEVGLFS
jgi:hypothetical protein